MPTVSQKGQVTIPVDVRESLGINPGDEIQFEKTDTGYVLQKQVTDDRFEKWHGAITTEQTMRERMEELRDRPLDVHSDGDEAADDTTNGSAGRTGDVDPSPDGGD